MNLSGLDIAAEYWLELVQENVSMFGLEDQWWTEANGSFATSSDHYSYVHKQMHAQVSKTQRTQRRLVIA